jgi:hypothetical protein
VGFGVGLLCTRITISRDCKQFPLYFQRRGWTQVLLASASSGLQIQRMLDPSSSPSASAPPESVLRLELALRQKPNNSGILLLWTGMLPEGCFTFSRGPIFSKPLDSAVLVQSFEPAPDRRFFQSPEPEVGVSLPRASGTLTKNVNTEAFWKRHIRSLLKVQPSCRGRTGTPAVAQPGP